MMEWNEIRSHWHLTWNVIPVSDNDTFMLDILYSLPVQSHFSFDVKLNDADTINMKTTAEMCIKEKY